MIGLINYMIFIILIMILYSYIKYETDIVIIIILIHYNLNCYDMFIQIVDKWRYIINMYAWEKFNSSSIAKIVCTVTYYYYIINY